MADPTTNVPGPTFGPNGFIVPDEADVLAGVQADINAAFGGGLNPALETPQGQLASSTAAVIGNVNDTFLKYTQQVDPAYADGRMQDAIARIYFIERLPSLPTTAVATCVGAVGVPIPEGAKAADDSGTLYTCTQAGIIPESGAIDLTFACDEVGPIPCPANSLTTIYTVIPGWDSITNAADGVLGRDTETRAAFEERRRLSVAQNANGSLAAVLGAVLNVDGVVDAYVTENPNNTTLVINGVTLQPNSLYAAVAGGAAADIARAIWSRKSPGCGYNGNTLVTVVDDNPAYNPPYPSYSVAFQTAVSTPILFAVSIANSQYVPADAATQIQNAIISAFAGEDGGPRARIGSIIYASRFYAPIAALGSWAQIINVKVGSQDSPAAQVTATVAGTTMTVSAVASGVLAVGQSIIGANVPPGTIIAALGTGTGGTGTYILNASLSIPAPTILYAVTPAMDDVTMRIDQVPTISANDIAVSVS